MGAYGDDQFKKLIEMRKLMQPAQVNIGELILLDLLTLNFIKMKVYKSSFDTWNKNRLEQITNKIRTITLSDLQNNLNKLRLRTYTLKVK